MRRSSRGAAVVDFVLILGLLLPLVLGVLQLALVLFVRNTLASAASEGARYAATADHGPADGVAKARGQLEGVLSARYAEGIRARSTTIDGAPAIEIVIHAEVPALGLGGPALALDVAGHAIEEKP
ncbi:TadE/TadG family type IV pilus assembly protein [Nocardioides sp. CER19]|uniref:TadE/TadG family type IV pilus assembly protein n=1 Tax=Nocardioides sp. CER19 TaxID=3038538 RepID=UPI002449CE58|nr:TadE/TadG family type IV pilus assembly protein [Nocardioides sp. CER19]MDH2413958.1 TadE/TadG family type IV pilus assembly protein [Nocardioides sp. CER19]